MASYVQNIYFFKFRFVRAAALAPPLRVVFARVLIKVCPVILAQTDIDYKISKKFSIYFYTRL